MKINLNTWSETNLKRLKLIIFIIKLNLFSLPLYLILLTNTNLVFIENLIAIIVKNYFQILGYNVNLGTILETEGLIPLLTIQGLDYSIAIGSACTGYRSVFALTALILATSKKNNKYKYLIIYLIILFLINIIRILTTIMVGIYFNKNFFNITHNFLWREGLIIIVLLLYLYYLKKAS